MRQTNLIKKCPICQKEAVGLFRSKNELKCEQCAKKFVKARNPHVLYLYDDFFREVLYRYKALGDLALADIFLEEERRYLKKRYKDYIIVLVPSNSQENFRRGFAFLPWMFKSLDLPMISPFSKRVQYKQASSRNREDIKNVIVLKDKLFISHKKVLVVDDVMTSGYTLKTCMDLLKEYHPKKIDYLVLASKKDNISQAIKNIEERRK